MSQVAFREMNVGLGSGAHSTRNNVSLEQDVTGANVGLMDVDNDILESYATVDEVGFEQVGRGSCRDGRLVDGPPGVAFRPHVDVLASRLPPPLRDLGRPSYSPFDQENPRASRPAPTCQLSKTEMMVVREMLGKIETVDGADEMQLVNFLKKLSPVFHIAPNCAKEIIKLLISKVTGPMFNLCIEAVAAHADWDDLHEEILARFIPPLRRREIASYELDRPQRSGETYAEYVEHLISAAFALKTSLSESDVVEIAIRKCRPEIRSHFVFGSLPTTIAELRSFAHNVTSSVRAEARYFGGTQSQNFHTPRNPRANPPMPNDLRNRPRDKVARCFRCQQEGHIARNCRINLN